jgi:hypothetical protein
MDATVKAYVDFSGFSEKNVQRTADGKITITLPDPRIVLTGTKVNHDEVRQYVAFTRSNFTDAELADYEQQGRQSIIQALHEMGIVENARANAAHTIIPLIVAMGWKEEMLRQQNYADGIERNLFPDLSPEEMKIVDLLKQTNDLQLNIISVKCSLPISQLTALLFQMEMKGVIKPLAGGMYHLLM